MNKKLCIVCLSSLAQCEFLALPDFVAISHIIHVGPPVAASSSHEQVDHETMNESFIGEWSDDEEEESETEEAGSAPPPQRRVVTQSSRTKKQYTETVHVSVRNKLILCRVYCAFLVRCSE